MYGWTHVYTCLHRGATERRRPHVELLHHVNQFGENVFAAVIRNEWHRHLPTQHSRHTLPVCMPPGTVTKRINCQISRVRAMNWSSADTATVTCDIKAATKFGVVCFDDLRQRAELGQSVLQQTQHSLIAIRTENLSTEEIEYEGGWIACQASVDC